MIAVTKKRFVTFIIPSLNRPSLVRSLDSLFNQTDTDWCCIIVFDGYDKKIKINKSYQDRIQCIQHDNIGEAGLLRNVGLTEVSSSWTAFLDDDDYLKPTYVEHLRNYANKDQDLELIYFSIDRNNRIDRLLMSLLVCIIVVFRLRLELI